MKDLMTELEKKLNKDWIQNNIINLYRIERLQTFPAYIKSARYVYDLLKAEGFEAELVDFPADGKTVVHDVCLPIGWDVKNMTLKLITDIDGIPNGILADYTQNPCSAVKHSVGTPANGIDALLVSEDDFKNGADVNGCFVLFNQNTRPGRNNLKGILDKGAIGWVSDFCENPGEAPNHTAWLNSGTETGSWHVGATDRDFIGYQITPNHGELLRKAYKKEKIYVKAYSDAKRFESKLPFVSAYLPGKSKKEIWVLAHMYEPLIDDNSNGVIGSIAILKALRDLVKEGKYNLEYSVRLVFGSEVYGFSCAAEYYGGDLSNRTIGGINMDCLPASIEKGKYRQWRMFEAPDHPANFANIVFHEVENAAKKLHPEYMFTTHPAIYGDDQLLGDSTISLPTVWFLRGGYNCFHHNSILTEEYLDMDVFMATLYLSGTWICAMATLNESGINNILPNALKHSQNLLDNAINKPLRDGTDVCDYMNFLLNREKNSILSLGHVTENSDVIKTANSLKLPVLTQNTSSGDNSVLNSLEKYIFTRKTRGLPFDMTRIANRELQYKRGLFIYFPLASILARMDGHKNLKNIVLECEWSLGRVYPDSLLQEFLDVCLILTEHGYLDCKEI